jgi:antitoxin ParD1/3/4
MAEFQITLPEDAAAYVQGQIAAGKFSSPSEVLADALREKQVQAAKARLAELIREGIESGDPVEVTDEWWDQLDEKVQAELRRRQSA